MRPRICVIFSPQGLETLRIVASDQKEEAEGEKLLQWLQDDLEKVSFRCSAFHGHDDPEEDPEQLKLAFMKEGGD